eukprot:COSAG04_NODE_1578_length_6256_cov_4.952899_5_plen_253_part_00
MALGARPVSLAWYDATQSMVAQYPVAAIPWSNLTHIVYNGGYQPFPNGSLAVGQDRDCSPTGCTTENREKRVVLQIVGGGSVTQIAVGRPQAAAVGAGALQDTTQLAGDMPSRCYAHGSGLPTCFFRGAVGWHASMLVGWATRGSANAHLAGELRFCKCLCSTLRPTCHRGVVAQPQAACLLSSGGPFFFFFFFFSSSFFFRLEEPTRGKQETGIPALTSAARPRVRNPQKICARAAGQLSRSGQRSWTRGR